MISSAQRHIFFKVAKSCPPSLQLGNASGFYPLLWRFLPVLDPQVSLFFSRDLDSQVGERELAAVMEFVKSPDASVRNSFILTSWIPQVDANVAKEQKCTLHWQSFLSFCLFFRCMLWETIEPTTSAFWVVPGVPSWPIQSFERLGTWASGTYLGIRGLERQGPSLGRTSTFWIGKC